MNRTIIYNMDDKTNRLFSTQNESSPKFLKLAHLHRLFKGKQQYILEMLDLFMEQLPTALSKIEEHIKTQNKKGIHYEAHTIKSTIKTVGLRELATSAVRLELCEPDTWDEIEANYKTFKNQALIEVEALNKERDMFMKMSR